MVSGIINIIIILVTYSHIHTPMYPQLLLNNLFSMNIKITSLFQNVSSLKVSEL